MSLHSRHNREICDGDDLITESAETRPIDEYLVVVAVHIGWTHPTDSGRLWDATHMKRSAIRIETTARGQTVTGSEAHRRAQ